MCTYKSCLCAFKGTLLTIIVHEETLNGMLLCSRSGRGKTKTTTGSEKASCGCPGRATAAPLQEHGNEPRG